MGRVARQREQEIDGISSPGEGWWISVGEVVA
jgi:hypothetical protein